MPGIHIDFSEEEYNAIPRPKRTWIRDLVRERLGVKPSKVVATIPVAVGAAEAEPREFYFRVDGQIVSALALRPADAARQLGIEGIADWKTREEAEKAGWLETEDPMEV